MAMGSGHVAVVTDSTAYLPPGMADEFAIRVVPLRVTIGNRTGTDGVDISPAEVTVALRERVSVTTSRPSVDFYWSSPTYRNRSHLTCTCC